MGAADQVMLLIQLVVMLMALGTQVPEPLVLLGRELTAWQKMEPVRLPQPAATVAAGVQAAQAEHLLIMLEARVVRVVAQYLGTQILLG